MINLAERVQPHEIVSFHFPKQRPPPSLNDSASGKKEDDVEHTILGYDQQDTIEKLPDFESCLT